MLDFSDDPDGFRAHIERVLALPCVHCEQVAPTIEREGRSLFQPRDRQPIEIVCAASGERRATFQPTGRTEDRSDR